MGDITASAVQEDETPLLDAGADVELLETGEHSSDGGVRVERVRVASATHTKAPCYIYLLAFLSAIGGFLFGYDTGVVAGAMLPIQEKFHFDDVWKELFVSITVGAAAIFAIVGGQVNDWLGRKPATLIASFVFALGAVLLAAAQNTATLMIGRFILGVGIGFASMTVPVYLAEAAPAHLRGRLVTLFQAFISGGMFISLIVSASFCPVQEGWRYMLGLAAIPPCIQFVGFLFMPESPRWLVSQGKDQQAIEVLKKIRGGSDVSVEFDAIKKACDEEAEAKKRNVGGQTIVRKVLSNPPVRRALFIGCVLQLFQQITGINTVMYYSATIVQMSGVSDNCRAIWLASITAFSNFIFTFVGIALVEKMGRRLLFLASLAGVTVALVILGIGFQVQSAHTPSLTPEPDSTDPCSRTFTTCNQCIDDDKCGFCFVKLSNNSLSDMTCLSSGENGAVPISHACGTEATWAYSYCPSPYAWLSVFGMVVYLAAFSPGMGPMPWTINSEIYPLWARSFGNSLATFVNWTFNLLISMTFLSLSSAITKHGAFYLYATFGIVGFVFFYLFLPETRGVALEDMEVLFSGSWFVRSKSRRHTT